METNKDDLGKLFNMPCETVRTSGIQDGVILKFACFYLKIYDAEKEDAYIIEGYKYGSSDILFKDCIPRKDMRIYAATFML